jgi:2-methylcitrate dehydratase PrpD
MMNETRRLAEFVAETGYEDLPGEVVEATRVYILDNLASGFVGSLTPWADMVAGLAQENASVGPCSVFAQDWATTPSYAALVNGTMIGSFETDHAFVRGSCHPSAAVFPPVLAIAERDRMDGTSMLVSVALGYEVACRVGMAATRAVEDEAGFHGPGTNASFGGASGAGKALGLDAGGLVNALGIAGSHAGGLLEFSKEGAMTKRIHVGRGGQMGLESALLAERGFTGPSTVLEGDRGFLRVYSPSPRPELLTEGLGEGYILLEMTVKAYACHASFHPVIEGICRFKESNQYDPARLDAVKVVGTGRMVHRHGDRGPTSILGAQYSLPFSVAVALCRDIASPQVYSEEALWDPQVRRIAEMVEMAADDERLGKPGGPVAEVSLTIAGKTHTFQATGWRGAPGNPCTYNDMSEKFRRYASPVLSKEGATESIEDIIRKVRHLENVSDVSELARMLRAGR